MNLDIFWRNPCLGHRYTPKNLHIRGSNMSVHFIPCYIDIYVCKLEVSFALEVLWLCFGFELR